MSCFLEPFVCAFQAIFRSPTFFIPFYPVTLFVRYITRYESYLSKHANYERVESCKRKKKRKKLLEQAAHVRFKLNFVLKHFTIFQSRTIRFFVKPFFSLSSKHNFPYLKKKKTFNSVLQKFVQVFSRRISIP